MKKVVVGLLSSRRNCVRQDWILRSWGRQCDVVFYSDHRDPTRRVYRVSDQTHYRSNEEKHINFLNQVGIQLVDDYEWLFCADDDSFVCPANLNAWIDSLTDRNQVYANLITYQNAPDNPIYQRIDRSVVYPAGGAGYLISREVMRKVYPFTNHATGFSDVSFGMNMARCRVPQVDASDRLFSQPPEFYGHGPEQIQRAVSYHYIKTPEAIQTLSEATGQGRVTLPAKPELKGLFWRYWRW